MIKKRKKHLLDEIATLRNKISALEMTEDRLKQSEQMFHALFEQAGGYSMILDPNTPDGIPIIVDANKAACDYHGYVKEEFIGKPIVLIDDDTGKRLVKKHTQLIMTGEPFYIENRHVRKDGTIFHVAVNAQRIDIGNNPPLILSIEYDITERILTQKLLSESEARFRLAILNMPFPIMIHADDGEVLQINKIWTDLTGYEYEEVNTIEKWAIRAFGRRQDEIQNLIDSLYAKTTNLATEIGEYKITKKNGDIIYWIFYTSPLGNLPDGRRVIISSAVDITDRKSADQEIKKLSLFPSENPNPVIRLNQSGDILYANEEGGKILAIITEKKNSILGTQLEEQLNHVIETKEKANFEIMIDNKWYLFIFTPVLHEAYINIYGTDISETKRLLDEITHSEKMKAIGQIAGGIAHDFNNQLGALLGNIELLEIKVEARPEEKQVVAQMKKIVDQAKTLTEQLLSFSRKGKNLHEAIDINTVLMDISIIIERSIDKKITIQNRLGSFSETIMGDPSQLHNALLNIALNARDAMPGGGNLLFQTACKQISYESIAAQNLKLAPGKYICVDIIDTGCGMSDEVLENAIEPFFTTKEEGQGTGMGLSAAYGAMKAHEGEISISSEVDKGTTIKLFFPASTTPAVIPSNTVVPHQTPIGKGLVMFVDDNELICDVASKMIPIMGYEVKVFTNPHEALGFFRENAAAMAFVIIDMIMPEMDGKELYQELKNIRADIKVILSSGYSAEGEAQSLLDNGVQYFIHKPFTMAELANTIEKITCD